VEEEDQVQQDDQRPGPERQVRDLRVERMAQPGPVEQRLDRLARPASKDGTGPALQRVAERLEPALALEEAIDRAMQHDSSLHAAGRAGSVTRLPASAAFEPHAGRERGYAAG